MRTSCLSVAPSSLIAASTPSEESSLSAEALAADLRPHQRQLTAAAQEMLVGCDDAAWQVAAPTSCTIICALGELASRPTCRIDSVPVGPRAVEHVLLGH